MRTIPVASDHHGDVGSKIWCNGQHLAKKSRLRRSLSAEAGAVFIVIIIARIIPSTAGETCSERRGGNIIEQKRLSNRYQATSRENSRKTSKNGEMRLVSLGGSGGNRKWLSL